MEFEDREIREKRFLIQLIEQRRFVWHKGEDLFGNNNIMIREFNIISNHMNEHFNTRKFNGK